MAKSYLRLSLRSETGPGHCMYCFKSAAKSTSWLYHEVRIWNNVTVHVRCPTYLVGQVQPKFFVKCSSSSNASMFPRVPR